MIDYKDDVSIRLGVALSIWTPPALTSQHICENVFNMQGERKMLSSSMSYALDFPITLSWFQME